MPNTKRKSPRQRRRRTSKAQPRAAKVQRPLAPPDPAALIVSRQQAARMLSCSIRTVQRLEERGQLKAVKLTQTTGGMVYFNTDQVKALAQGGASQTPAS